MWIYNVTDNTWMPGTPFPYGTIAAGAITALDGQLYMYGGTGMHTPPTAVYTYEPGFDDWLYYTDNGPSARLGLSMAPIAHTFDNATFFIFGGVTTAAGDLNDYWLWTVGEGWYYMSLVTGPQGRYLHSAVALDGSMIVFGGLSSFFGHDAVLGDTWVLNIASTQWFQMQLLLSPPARFAHAAVSVSGGGLSGSSMIVFGGIANATNAQPSLLGDTWRLELLENLLSWTKDHPIQSPSPRGAMAAAAMVLPGTNVTGMLVMGGFNASGGCRAPPGPAAGPHVRC